MSELPFSIELMQFLVDHRTEPLLSFFSFWSDFGDVEGYIFVIAVIYTMYDKSLAFRLAVIVLIAMCLNHFIKTIVQNPRPFITDGTYLEKWAVSPDTAQSLATEYSTPSGHAMSGAAFYAYLYACVTNRYVKIFAVIALILTGLSRPYLGVHYLEDIVLGWAVGLALFALVWNSSAWIDRVWNGLSHGRQILMVSLGCLLFWLVTFMMNGASIETQPLPFVSFLGFLTGITIAYPLELRWVGFDPKSSAWILRLSRLLIVVLFAAVPVMAVDAIFDAGLKQASYIGHLVQYVGFGIAGFSAMFLAPWLIGKLKLAELQPASDAG